MGRLRWHPRAPTFMLFIVFIALNLFTCGPEVAAASGAAPLPVRAPSVDVLTEQGVNENAASEGGRSGDAEKQNEEPFSIQEELNDPQREDLYYSEEKRPAGAPGVSASTVFKNLITFALTIAIVVLSARIMWDISNFVGDVPDPFADVQSADEIPAAIEELLDQDRPVAFVIRRCKYCGLGIRAMKAAGLNPVVVMVEGHPFQGVIRDHLRTVYKVRGLPYFFLNKDDHGYLSAIKGYLEDEH